MLNYYHYRRWYRTTTWIDFCCFYLQLNQHLTAFLQRYKHKEKKELPVWEHIERLRSYMHPKRPWPTNETTAVLIRLRIKTRIRADTHTNTTPLLALYCHPNNPVAGTVLLPESDNCCAYMHAIYRLTDRAYVPAIYRPTDRWALRSTTITTRRSHRTATWI